MNIEQEIQNILDRNFTRGDNAKALKELLDLFGVSKSGRNCSTCKHLMSFEGKVECDKCDINFNRWQSRTVC